MKLIGRIAENLVYVICVAGFLLGLTASNCQPKPILVDLANCEKSAAVHNLPDILPLVTSILVSGGTTDAINSALLGIAGKFGMDSLDCAIAAVMSAAKQQASQLKTADVAASGSVLVKRAENWLSSRGQSTRSVGATP